MILPFKPSHFLQYFDRFTVKHALQDTHYFSDTEAVEACVRFRFLYVMNTVFCCIIGRPIKWRMATTDVKYSMVVKCLFIIFSCKNLAKKLNKSFVESSFSLLTGISNGIKSLTAVKAVFFAYFVACGLMFS